MLTFLDCFSFELKCPLQPSGDMLCVSEKAVERLNTMAIGDHVYITLRYLHRYEIVRYDHSKPLKGAQIPVTRGMNGNTVMNFPRGSCVAIEWTKQTMDEYIAQGANHDV